MTAAATTLPMGKKKPSGGKHSTPRTPIQLPAAWVRVARKYAREVPQPTVWFLVSLIKSHAEARGAQAAELPPAPWDEEEPRPRKPKS